MVAKRRLFLCVRRRQTNGQRRSPDSHWHRPEPRRDDSRGGRQVRKRNLDENRKAILEGRVLVHADKTRPLLRCSSLPGSRKRFYDFRSYLFHGWRSLQPAEHFLAQQLIGRGPRTVFIVVNDRFSEARRFRQPRAARNDRLENFLSEMLSYFADNLLREICSTVIHRHHNPQQLQT